MSQPLTQNKWRSFPKTHKWILLACLLGIATTATLAGFEKKQRALAHIAEHDALSGFLAASQHSNKEPLNKTGETASPTATLDNMEPLENTAPHSLEYTISTIAYLTNILLPSHITHKPPTHQLKTSA